MISPADFEELFPDLFGPEAASDGQDGKPRPARLSKWERDGRQTRQGSPRRDRPTPVNASPPA